MSSRAGLASAATAANLTGDATFEPRWLRFLFLDAPIAIAILRGPEHVLALMNSAAVRIAGGRDLTGRPLREAFPEAIDAQVLERLDTALRTGQPLTHYERAVQLDLHGNGRPEERFINYRVEPTRGENGEVDGLVAFVTDATDEVRARRRVEESRTQQAAILEQLPIGILAIDSARRTIFANEAARRIAGILPDLTEPLDRTIDRYAIRRSDTLKRPEARNLVLAGALSGVALSTIDYVIKKPTSRRDTRVRVTATPLHAADGGVCGAILILAELDEHAD